LIEGDRQADKKILDRMLYHVRQAVTLTTSCLDCLAWLAAEIEGSSIDRRQIAWRKLRSRAAWVAALQDPTARSIAGVAERHEKAGIMDFVHRATLAKRIDVQCRSATTVKDLRMQASVFALIAECSGGAAIGA
jgi:hypothetical protein